MYHKYKYAILLKTSIKEKSKKKNQKKKIYINKSINFRALVAQSQVLPKNDFFVFFNIFMRFKKCDK